MSYTAYSYETINRRLRIGIVIASILCLIILISAAYFNPTLKSKTDIAKNLVTENRVNTSVPDEIGKLPNGNKLMRVTVLDKQRVPTYYFYQEASK